MSGDSENVDQGEYAGLTAGERAYMMSGGEDAAGLLSEAGTPAPEPAKVDAPAAPAPAPEPAKADAPAAPAAVKEPAAAAPADDDDDAVEFEQPAAKGQKQKFVPFGKFDRERGKAKEKITTLEKTLAERESELNRLRETYARGDERLKLLTEALNPQTQQQAEEDPKPDPAQDLIGYVQWQDRQIARLQESHGEIRQTFQETTAQQAMRENYQRDAMAFARETPDFGPAYQFLLNSRGEMLVSMGYSPEQASKLVAQEERGLVQRAQEIGRRPAELIYHMARQMGWRAEAAQPQPAPQPQPQAAPSGNGAAPANGTPSQPNVSEEIDRIARGQATSKSLSGGGGGSSPELSVEALASMSEREFNDFYAKQKGKVDALLGRPN